MVGEFEGVPLEDQEGEAEVVGIIVLLGVRVRKGVWDTLGVGETDRETVLEKVGESVGLGVIVTEAVEVGDLEGVGVDREDRVGVRDTLEQIEVDEVTEGEEEVEGVKLFLLVGDPVMEEDAEMDKVVLELRDTEAEFEPFMNVNDKIGDVEAETLKDREIVPELHPDVVAEALSVPVGVEVRHKEGVGDTVALIPGVRDRLGVSDTVEQWEALPLAELLAEME